MIRLVTVFSGIKHKIVFACDNGDVDILTIPSRISF